jgi:Lon protease-like protein
MGSSAPLPPTLPIFPLPGVVLFPHVLLPLHIFEARYREMVESVLDSHRLIGMVLLRPGFEPDYAGRPPVYPVGCAGVITNCHRLDDGRYNLVLQGVEKFRVSGEDDSRAFRLAHVESLPEPTTLPDMAILRQRRNRLNALVARSIERAGGQPRLTETAADHALVNALAQYLDLEPVERQHLLERDGVLARADGLIELLEMRLRSDGPAPPPGAVH